MWYIFNTANNTANTFAPSTYFNESYPDNWRTMFYWMWFKFITYSETVVETTDFQSFLENTALFKLK